MLTNYANYEESRATIESDIFKKKYKDERSFKVLTKNISNLYPDLLTLHDDIFIWPYNYASESHLMNATITIARDPRSGVSVVIDGTHRLNLLRTYFSHRLLTIKEVICFVPFQIKAQINRKETPLSR
jgi:hypothetical protein